MESKNRIQKFHGTVVLLLLLSPFACYILRVNNNQNISPKIATVIYTNRNTVRSSEGQNYTILLWTPRSPKLGQTPFESCTFSNCEIVTDRKLLNKSDALVIDLHKIYSVMDVPQFHNPKQPWIIFSHESPGNLRKNYNLFNGIFNFTMTYASFSDIPKPYFTVTKNSGTFQFQKMNNAVKSKSKLIAWFVSHCKTQSGRKHYVELLQRYIPVDIYGECGSLKCSKKNNSDCRKMVEQDYKFFLSFENSFCVDYVTEKVSRIMNYFVVPVVLGAADYSSILPPHSYIDARNFSSPEKLAKYLYELDANDTLYSEYFKWKKYYKVQDLNFHCPLCEHMNRNQEHKVIEKLGEFWNYSESCYRAIDYYREFLTDVKQDEMPDFWTAVEKRVQKG